MVQKVFRYVAKIPKVKVLMSICHFTGLLYLMFMFIFCLLD